MAASILRASDEHDPDARVRVTNMELFFDLVSVFAITQLSDFLFGHASGHGALQALVLFVAVWWAWNYTAWATNWLDPDRSAGTALMIVLMLASLVMAAALPQAFEGRGAPFAVAYASLQVIRTSVVAWGFPAGDRMRRNNLRLLAWLVIGGAIWVVGAYLDGDVRLAVWAGAAAVELAAPIHGFALPGVGSTPVEEWRLAGTHLAERYQLVLMIALGESVLRVGLTWSEQHGSFAVDAAFVLGFLATVSLWAGYFVDVAERGAARVAGGGGARTGRSAYAYAHAVMVAGVIIVAVAIHLAIAEPRATVDVFSACVLLGGPALYLAGLALFKRGAEVASPRPVLAAIVVLALLGIAAIAGTDRLVLLACATAVLLVLVLVRPLLERRPTAAR
ncbi:MAG TPA: low temperature requirement protein A [Solirubrobacteraceae bacterium]|nr:low temperature requirement protein A [Solirubrobacteraceae bacterium]